MAHWLDLPIKSHDFETCRFRPGLQAPPPVCLSAAWLERGEVVGTIWPTLELEDAYRQLVTDAADGKVLLVGHNVAYDSAVALAWIDDIAEPLFAAYERDAIVDTMLFERIAEIGKFTPRKTLSLQHVGAAYGIELTKDTAVRTGYGPLYGAPLDEYPQAHRQYPIDDAVNTYNLLQRQIKRHGKHVHLKDVAFICRKQFWLQLTRNWGMRTDPEKLDQLRKETQKHVDELRALAQEAGLVRPDGSRDMKAIRAAVSAAYDGRPPMTEEARSRKSSKPFVPQVSTSKVTLQESGDFILEQFAEYGEWSAVQNKDLKLLARGVEFPIHTKFGVADTTRSTSSDPNMQNFRRKEGIRECVVAREGHALISVDHGGLELCTLAQVLVWLKIGRGMADKINAGVDLHCDVAKELCGLTYEETVRRKEAGDRDVKNKRNCAKVVNFGRPGFMGASTLVHYAKYSYGVDFAKVDPSVPPLEFSQRLIRHWERANPEGAEYLRYVSRSPEAAGGKVVTIPGTTIVRRGASVCAAANSRFQGLGAVLEAYVGWCIAREMYTGRHWDGAPGTSVLINARLVNFVHDEFIVETPLRFVTPVANRLETIMAEAPRRFLPDVQIGSEAVAMLRWSKLAERIVRDGELIPWTGEEAA